VQSTLRQVGSTFGVAIMVAAEKFMEYKTSGLPVVDGQDHLVGFISDGDILRYLSNRDVEFVTTEYAYIFPDRETFIEKATELLEHIFDDEKESSSRTTIYIIIGYNYAVKGGADYALSYQSEEQ
jgi:CBS domain-containing protein